MTKKRGPKFGAVVAPPDATEKNRNIGAQLLQKGFGKSTSCGTSGPTSLFIPSRFWTTDTKFNTCCQRYVVTCGKFLYRCTSTITALSYCSRIFFQTAQLSIRSAAHNLFRRFFGFSQFLIAILRKLCRRLSTKMRTM